MNFKRIITNVGGTAIAALGVNFILESMPIKANMSENKGKTGLKIKATDTDETIFTYSTDRPLFKK